MKVFIFIANNLFLFNNNFNLILIILYFIKLIFYSTMINEGDLCKFCNEKPFDAIKLPCCKNIFCSECIRNWLNSHFTCPMNCGLLFKQDLFKNSYKIIEKNKKLKKNEKNSKILKSDKSSKKQKNEKENLNDFFEKEDENDRKVNDAFDSFKILINSQKQTIELFKKLYFCFENLFFNNQQKKESKISFLEKILHQKLNFMDSIIEKIEKIFNFTKSQEKKKNKIDIFVSDFEKISSIDNKKNNLEPLQEMIYKPNIIKKNKQEKKHSKILELLKNPEKMYKREKIFTETQNYFENKNESFKFEDDKNVILKKNNSFIFLIIIILNKYNL